MSEPCWRDGRGLVCRTHNPLLKTGTQSRTEVERPIIATHAMFTSCTLPTLCKRRTHHTLGAVLMRVHTPNTFYFDPSVHIAYSYDTAQIMCLLHAPHMSFHSASLGKHLPCATHLKRPHSHVTNPPHVTHPPRPHTRSRPTTQTIHPSL